MILSIGLLFVQLGAGVMLAFYLIFQASTDKIIFGFAFFLYPLFNYPWKVLGSFIEKWVGLPTTQFYERYQTVLQIIGFRMISLFMEVDEDGF